MTAKPFSCSTFPSLLLTCALAFTTMWSAPAHAGFEWLKDGQTPYSDTPAKDPMVDLDKLLNEGTLTPNYPMPQVYQSAPNTIQPEQVLPAQNGGYRPQAGDAPKAYYEPRPAMKTINGLYADTPATNAGDAAQFLPLPGQIQQQTPITGVQSAPKKSMQDFTNANPMQKSVVRSILDVPAKAMEPSNPTRKGEALSIPSGAPDLKMIAAMPDTHATSPATMTGQSGALAVVDGFGSEMPLALALRQIVPPEYAFSFGKGVNPGYRVSWTGGKPWNLVVSDMIVPLNLVANVRNNKIYINQYGSSNSAPTTAMTMSPVLRSNTLAPLPEMEITSAPVAPVSAMPLPMPVPQPDMTQQNIVVSSSNTMGAGNTDGTYRRNNIIDPGQDRRPQEVSTLAKIKRLVVPEKNKITDLSNPFMPSPIPNALPDTKQQTNYGLANNTFMAHQQNAATPQSAATATSASPLFNAQVPLSSDMSQTTKFWEAQQGSSLHETLTTWAKQANVNIVWQARNDYPITNNVMANGSFMNALKTVLTQGVGNNAPEMAYIETPGSATKATVIIKDMKG